MKKIKLGIDINEIFRSLWYQFDRYYTMEFGEDGVPDDVYVYNFFKDYKWEEKKEVIQYLREDLPEDISPLDYQIDEKTGEAPVDALAFRKEVNELDKKAVYNRFMYEDYLYEIFGAAPIMYKNLSLDLEKFNKKFNKYIEIHVVSKENYFSIPPTLFFLSKIMPRFKHYHLVETNDEIWDNIDMLITTDPDILNDKIPKGKKLIKADRPYNVNDNNGEFKILNIIDLIENDDFKKLINYKEKKKK